MTRFTGRPPVYSIVAVDPFAPFVALLGLDRQGCDRTGVEPLEADRLAGFLAVTISTVVNSLQRSIDLGDQLPLAVTRAELDSAIGLRGGSVGKIGVVLALVLQVLKGLLCFAQDIVAPSQQLAAKILALSLVHERLG